jgi:hypothetical protein
MEVFFMKRIFGVILCIEMVLILFSFDAVAAITNNGFSYEILADNTVVITDYSGTSIDLQIPSSIEGKSVSTIGDYAFYRHSNIVSITIPEGVTSIGYSAFSDCSNLVSITIPKSVTSIGDHAFALCSNLTNITIPEGLTYIGSCLFFACRSIVSVTIPKSVTSIGNMAFFDCENLTSVTISEGVTWIGIEAFVPCPKLTSIAIPYSVTFIGFNAFENTTLYVLEGSYAYQYAINNATIDDGFTYQIISEQNDQEEESSQFHTLTIGSIGSDVAKLQQRMYELGYFNTNTVNETFTTTTAEYIKEFEIANGLLVDGIADPEMQVLFYSDKAIPKP